MLLALGFLIPACGNGTSVSLPPPPAPLTPAPFSVTVISSTEIDLHWVNGAYPQTAVSIERSLDDVNFIVVASLGGNAIVYRDLMVLPSTTYYYQIRAFNGSSPSPYTGVVAATTKTPAWVQLSPGTPVPSVRTNLGSTFAVASNSMIVCAGDDASFPPANTQTWALNNSGSGTPSWTQIGTGTNPGVRTSPGVAYSPSSQVFGPASNAVILFGGLNQSNPASVVFENDVWVLNPVSPTNWSPVVTAGTPAPPRFGHAVAFAGSKLYVIGGQNANSTTLPNPPNNNLMNDVWTLDFSSATPLWSELLPSGPMAPRAFHSAIYDQANDQIILFGGTDGTNLRNDTWALHLGAAPFWSQLLTGGSPPSARSSCSAVYHASADLMIVFGGNSFTGSVNDVWVLSLSGIPTWLPLTVMGTPPGTRGGHAAAFNDADNRMNMFGGQDSTTFTLYPETWKLQF